MILDTSLKKLNCLFILGSLMKQGTYSRGAPSPSFCCIDKKHNELAKYFEIFRKCQQRLMETYYENLLRKFLIFQKIIPAREGLMCQYIYKIKSFLPLTTNEAVPMPIVRPTVHCLAIVVTMLLNIIMWGSAIMLVTMVMVLLCAAVLMLLVAII